MPILAAKQPFGSKQDIVEQWHAANDFIRRLKKQRAAQDRTVLDEELDAVMDAFMSFSVIDNFGRSFPLGPFRPTEPRKILRKVGLPPPASPPLGPFGPFPVPREENPFAGVVSALRHPSFSGTKAKIK